MIHLLIERHRNWGEDSETEMSEKVKQNMKIGGTNSKGNYLEMIIVAHLCAPPLPAWRSYDSHLKFIIAPAMQGECSNVVMIHFLMKNWKCRE